MTTATVLAIARDVSGERGADGALRAREERYRALLEYAADVVGILGPDGTVRYESAAVERVLGYRPEERLGRPALADVHPEDVTHVQAFLTAALAAPGATQPTTYRCRHKDGSWRHLEAFGRAVRTAGRRQQLGQGRCGALVAGSPRACTHGLGGTEMGKGILAFAELGAPEIVHLGRAAAPAERVLLARHFAGGAHRRIDGEIGSPAPAGADARRRGLRPGTAGEGEQQRRAGVSEA